MTRNSRHKAIKDAPVRMMVDISATKGTRLDDEDRQSLVDCGCGIMTREEMMSFFQRKAARIEAQPARPQ